MKYLLTRFAEVIINPDEVHIPKGTANNSALQEALQILFGIAGSVAVLIIAISAFSIVTSRGNAQDISRARDAIIYASIGLVVCLAAFMIVTFVVESI